MNIKTVHIAIIPLYVLYILLAFGACRADGPPASDPETQDDEQSYSSHYPTDSEEGIDIKSLAASGNTRLNSIGAWVYAHGVTVHLDLFKLDSDRQSELVGIGADVQAALPYRLSPYLNISYIAGYNNTEDRAFAGVSPEAGLRLWITGRFAFSLSARYPVTTEPGEQVLYGFGITKAFPY